MDSEALSQYVQLSAESLQKDPSSWWAREYLLRRGLTERTIRLYGLGYDQAKKSIVIPYLNATEEVVGYRYRLLEGDVKYLTPRGDRARLFHVRATRKPRVWVAEGEFDAMVLSQLGLTSVGVPGVKSFKDPWKYLFAYCEMVSLVFDGDEYGAQAASHIARLLTPFVPSVRLIHLPPGLDVNAMYLRDRKELERLVL